MEKEKTLQELEGTVQQDQKALTLEMTKVVVTSEEEMSRAATWLTQVKARIKKLEEKRKQYVQPLNDQVKAINDDFKTMMAPYLAIETEIKGKIGAFVDEQRRIQAEAERKERERRAEEARKIAEEQNISRQKAAAQVRQQEELKPQEVAPKPVTSVKTETAKVVTKKVVKFEIVDASKVPDEFKVVDERLVRAAVVKGARRISGVRIWEESQVSAF